MKPEDYTNMDWPIHLLTPEQNVLEEYDELAQRFNKFLLESLKVMKEITNDQLVRFIVYAYHKNSPFVRKITEPKHRKNQALLQAGVDLKLEEVKEIVDCENEKVNDLIFIFLQGENNYKFGALMMQMDAYFKMNFQLAYGGGATTKNNIEAIKSLEQNIEALSNEVFHGEGDLANFAQGAMNRGYVLSPEMNAHRKQV